MVRMILPKHLVFSGGGTRCLLFLPALRRLETRQQLTQVKYWWGTSAGALLASLMAITRSVEKVDTIMHQTEFARFRDVSLLNMVNFTDVWGLDDGHGMVTELERLLELAQPGASSYTLADVSGVRIPVADLNLFETVVCSAESFPTLRLVDALRASMSLPMFYVPFRCPINGHIWVDGGLRAAFPWMCLNPKEQKRALGFAFDRPWASQGPASFMDYIMSMMHFDDPVQTQRLKQEKANILWFPSPPFPAWYVRLQKDDYELLEQMGTTTVEEWFRNSPKTGESRPLSEVQHTPSPTGRSGRTDGMLGIPQSSCPPLLPGSPRDQSSRTRTSFRRWSF
jgi:predicted acylesterase/phospholipase RssA